jgi:hypothetical protein
MSSSNPTGFIDKVVGLCLSALVAAVTVFLAVKLVEAVRPLIVATRVPMGTAEGRAIGDWPHSPAAGW